MALQRLTALVAAAAAVSAQVTSPLFFFSSTANLDIPALPSAPKISDVHHALWGALSSCPTKHYAVVLQPEVSYCDYSSTYLPVTRNTRTTITAQNITGGHADHVAIINTILMDCLRKGVSTVEPLDTSNAGLADASLPELTQQRIDDRIIWASLPGLSTVGQRAASRKHVLDRHVDYVKKIIGEYFADDNYTLIYLTEKREPSKDAAAEETGALPEHVAQADEVPLVFDE